MSKLKRILLRKRIFYIIYCLIILTIAYLFNRFFQMLLFILLFIFIQSCFNYRFHADDIIKNNSKKATILCKIITIVVELIYLIFCKELNVSIYSNLFIILFITIINSLLQFYIKHIFITKDILKDKDLLISKSKELNISDIVINRLILRYFKNKSIKEIADIEFVNEETIKQSIRRAKRKLGI